MRPGPWAGDAANVAPERGSGRRARRYDWAVPDVRYVALGDSYTIGTCLSDQSENFPSRLAHELSQATGLDVTLINLGVNGYTTADLIREELPVAGASRPDVISVLIGANDVVQGSDHEAYRANLKQIYGSLARFGLASRRVVAVSIPDFSDVPAARAFGLARDLRARIDTFNQLARLEAEPHRFIYVDIAPLSRSGIGRMEWLAADGLHPAAAQHRAIAAHIWAAVGSDWRSVNGLDSRHGRERGDRL